MSVPFALLKSFPTFEPVSEETVPGPPPLTLWPSDTIAEVSDYGAIVERSARRLRFIRPITDGNAYQHCSPGSRWRIYTNATQITFNVFFNGLVTRQGGGHNGVACILLNGAQYATIINTAAETKTQARTYVLNFVSAVYRLIELVWPYGEGMDLISVTHSTGASFAGVPPRLSRKLAILGDSIPHGFAATKTTDTWAYKLAALNSRQLLNFANGSAVCVPADATTALTGCGADRVVYLIGYNNFVAQTALVTFQALLESWINNAEAALPSAKIYIVSMIYTDNTDTITPAQYRTSAAAAVTAVGGANTTLVNGLSIMTNNTNRLADGVHPNNLGAGEIATNLNALVAA